LIYLVFPSACRRAHGLLVVRRGDHWRRRYDRLTRHVRCV